MDQSHQQSSPSEKLSAMDLNSTPTKRARDDTTVDTSSPGSVFDNTPPYGSRSIGGSPSLASSPCPRTSGSPFELGLTRRISYPPMRRPSAKYAGAFGQPSFTKWSPKLPYEIWDMIFTAAVAIDAREEWNFTDENIYESPRTKETLSALRLVNRAWNQIVSPRLFSHLSAMVGRVTGRPLEAVFKISESQFAPYVHDLRIGILGPWQNGLDYELYITDLATGALPVLVARFPNLQTFRLQSPSMIAPLSPQDQISMLLLSQLTSSFVHSLRFVSLPRLRSLHLSLPVTAEFGRFFISDSYAIDFPSIMAQIQELHLIVNDDTGRDGHREVKRPRSQVKGRYPLQPFSGYLTTLINYAKQVKVLIVEVRSRLDLSDIESHSFTEMTHFRLVGVSITWESLRDIFQCSRATLRRIELEHVQLMSGTWDDIFDICRVDLPDIEFFATTRCGYSSSGASSHYIGHAHPFWPLSVLTLHKPDLDSLGNIRKMVNETRAKQGLVPSPHTTWIPRGSRAF